MYCGNCGNEFGPDDRFCGVCGNPNPKFIEVNNNVTPNNTATNNDKLLYGAIGFVAPLVGLILSLVTKKDKPEAAKIGIIVSCIRIFLTVMYYVIVYLFAYLVV